MSAASAMSRLLLWAIREIVRRRFAAASGASLGGIAASRARENQGPRIRGFVRARDSWGRPRLAANAVDVRDAEIVATRRAGPVDGLRGSVDSAIRRFAETWRGWPSAARLGPRTFEMER